MRMRQSEERFRGVESGNERTTSERKKLGVAIFSNRRKRSVGAALLGAVFVVGWPAFFASSVRADEPTVAANVSATTPDAFEYRIEEGFVTITGLREEFREATTVSVPKQIGMGTVKKIAPNAFQDRERLETVVFADATSLDEIGERAFAGCSALKSVDFGKGGVDVIGGWAFSECSALTAVELPKSVRVIGTGAFALCSSLATVSGGDGVEEIAPAAFGGCDALETFVIGPNVRKIGSGAFRGCKRLQNFELSASGNAAFKIIDGFLSPSEGGKPVDGFLTSADGKTLVACPTGRGGEVVVPEGVVEIGPGAFMMGALEAVVLPQTLKKIDANAFYSCDALKSVVGAPKALETIGVEAFADCDALERFDWPENLQTIEKQAFRGCGALTTAKIKSVRTIGANAFYCCAKLETLELPSATREIGAFAFAETGLKTFKAPRDLAVWNPGTTERSPVEKFEVEEGNDAFQVVDGALLSADGKTLYQRPQNAPETSWKIPDGVRVVAERALSGAASLTALEIPEGVETIGAGALRGCSALKKIAIPASLRQIDETFDDCSALAAFEVAEGSATFSSVDGSLLSKDGKTLYRMARNTEADAAPAEQFVVVGGYGPFATRVVPMGVERIAKGAFGNDRRLKNVEIPPTVKQIDAGAFGNCPNVRSISIPASVEQLDERFDSCSWLATFEVDPANPTYKSVDGALLSKDGKTFYRLAVRSEDYRKNATLEEGDHRKKYRYVVPEGVETIKAGAFAGAYRMSEIVFPQSLKKIETWAFNGSPLIESVVIPAGVQTIEDRAFAGCDLREVVLASKNAKFEKTAFLAGDFEAGKLTIRVDDKTLERKIENIEAEMIAEIAASNASEGKSDANKATVVGNLASVAATTPDAFEYKIEGVGATITGLREEFRGATTIHIPRQIGEIWVKKIESNAFAGLDRLETLYVNAHLTEMGDRAFADCGSLKQVYFRAPITEIGREAFAGCGELLSVEHDEILRVEAGAFSGCAGLGAALDVSSLAKFDVAGISEIAPNAFAGCWSLEKFENSATQNQRLQVVDGLVLSQDGRRLIACPPGRKGEIVVPEGVVWIAESACFRGAVESVVLPKTLEGIGEKAFAYCGKLKSVVGAPKTLETIRAEAFVGCAALERFDWPENLRTVEKSAFQLCMSLKSATLNNVRSVGERAFSDCRKLATLELSSETRELGSLAFAATALKSFKIPRGLEMLAARAFDWSAFESVEVEEGNEAFKVVDGALLSADGKILYWRPAKAPGTSWKIPEGVRVVVRGALANNESLVSVEIPEGVETIGEGAFSRCFALQKLAIPASVRRIDDRFERCDALETFEVAEGNPAYRSVDGALLSKDGKTLYRVARKGGAGTRTPETSRGFGVERVIPEGVERIAPGAIGDDALMGSLKIPASVKRIDAGAFGDCDRLKSLVIPASVERLDERFIGCDEILDFRVEQGNPNYKSYDGSLLSRDGKTFYRFVVADYWYRGETPRNADGSLAYRYVVPEGVRTIEENAFLGAMHMTEVDLPQTLRTIKSSAFSGAGLRSVAIPANVEKIERNAFSALKEVVLASSTAMFNKSAFTMKPSELTIRVDAATAKRDAEVAEAKRIAEKAAQETFEWEVGAGGKATITGVRDKMATSLDIPEKIDGAPVTDIGRGACSNLLQLKTVRIGANVERIDGAFQNCANLESVEFPSASDGSGESKLHAILNGGFESCSSLKKFAAPVSLVSVGPRSFSGCSALETVELSPQTREIGQGAFRNCSTLREIIIPENASEFLFIDDSAFNGCDALTSFDAPLQLNGLAPNAFGELERPFQFKLHPDSQRLRDVDGMILSRDGKTICAYFGPKTGELVIPEGVERVGQVFGSIFKGADFETIRFPKSLRVVALQAFMESKSLKRVVLPEDSELESIGMSAFRGCEALESFDWPKTLKTIGNSAFSGCRLKEFVGGDALEKIDAYAFSNCESLTKIELPSGLREIGNGAFSECGATSIKIPASVQSVGETAFATGALEKIEVEEGNEAVKVVDGALLSKDGKSLFRVPSALKLTSYKIPDGVEIIERAALGGNVTLETVEIPATVKTIEPNAFYRCVALKKISIPASVEKMDGAFNRCDGLEHFEVDPKNAVYKSENGALLSADGKTFYTVLAVERDAEAEAKAAASAAIEGVASDSTKPIYKNPVYRVPDGVETIASSAFSDEVGMRNAFTEIVLPESVKEIKRLAFARCKRLEKAFIPKNVAKIEEGVFKYCDALKTVEISPENPNYRLENGLLLSKDGKTFYEATRFYGGTVLRIPDGVEQIGNFWIWSAFEGSPTYTEVVLPESLTSIGTNAFTRWENLKKITIPKNVRNVAARAFYDCLNLSEVVLQSKDTVLDRDAFYRRPTNLKIRVEGVESEASEEAAAPVESSDSNETDANINAANETVSDAFEWREVQRGEVSIFGVRDKTATSVVIPETLGGAPVKTIGAFAFAGMRELKTIRLPRSLETIGATAFASCVNLEKVEFAKDENDAVASNLQKIDLQAFKGCVALKSFEAPDSLVALNSKAFVGCSALETATLGKNLETIPMGAFRDCVALTRVDCSRCEKLTQIGSNAFWGCDALSTFDAPKSLRNVEGTAFGERTTPFAFNVHPENAFLKTVDGCIVTKADNRLIVYCGERTGVLVVPDGVEEIGGSAFAGAAFETVRFPKSLRGVDKFAFAGCKSLKRVEIPEDSALVDVGQHSFVGCKALETFDWPKSLKQIGGSAFSDCASLKSLTGATSLESIGDSAFSDCKALATVELPNGLREIGAAAFLNDEFASIKIPASVEVLGPAGVACTGLEKIEVEEGNEILKVVDGALLSKDGKRLHRLPPALKKTSYKIPDGVEIVGRSALGGNVTLETVELPATITTIERDAFYRCERLKEIAIPAKTERIDKDAFVFCDALERFEVDANNAVYKSENGALLSKDGKTFYGVVAVERDPNAEPFVVEPSQEGEEPRLVAAYKSPIYRVPDGVTTISNDAFHDPRRARNAFTEIVLPEGLTVVGSNVFYRCERLETMRIPASVTHLGAWVTVGSEPTAPLPQITFAKNRALKTFEVAPESKTYRSEDGMLLSADGKVCYAVFTDKDRSVLKVPNGVVRITPEAFNALSATEIVLPEGLEFISPTTFRDCENLTSITIPKNVKQIHPQAFYNCPRLAEVVLKSSDTLYFSNSFEKVAPNLTIRVDEDYNASQEPVETLTAAQVKAVEPAKATQVNATEPAQVPVKLEKNVVVDVDKTLAQKDFEWREENGGATITGVKDKTATRLVIPETLGGLPVKAVGYVAFAQMSELKTVRIPLNLETIGSLAFGGCVKLETIEFAKDENGGVASRLREIGAEAFKGCAALKSFAAPDSLVKLGAGAFCKCPSLETAKLGKNLQDVPSYAFANCVALNSVDTSVCEALTAIQYDAFLNCGALSSFDAPKALRYVNATAFAGRSTPLTFNLDSESEFLKLVDGCLVTIADEEVNDKRLIAYFGERSGELVVPEGVVNVFISAFAGADFETVRLPKSVRIVNNEAFKDCKSLKRVVIPEDSELESIGNTAFGGCEALETFDWPKSLKVICALAFVDCKSLKSFTGATSVEEIRDSAFWNCRSLTTVELPSGLRQVGMTAFGNVGYETLKIPASLQVLGESAFASSSPREKLEVEEGSETLKIVDGALLSKDGKTFYRLPLGLNATSYKVPEGVEIIENGAFRGNATLETVEFPTSLKTIKKNAFYRCLALQGVAIPANVEQIDVEAFDGCDALERFEVDPNNAVYKSENGALLSADGATFYKLIAVPERDRDAEKRLLKDERLQALRSVEKLPNGEVRSLAPSYMDAKAAIVPVYKNGVYRVPDGVLTIGDGAFFDPFKTRNAFTEIVLPESLIVIGSNAFGACSRLETLRIPASVSQLGPSSAFPTTLLFTDCDALKTFEIAPENKNFRSEDGMLISPDGTVFYGVVANKKRSVLSIPASVEHLTGERNFGDPGKIIFPDSLTSIPQGKFRNLANLTSVTISKNIYNVNNSTFVDCPRLAEVVLRSKATVCSEEAFVRCAPNLTIRVDENAPTATDGASENVFELSKLNDGTVVVRGVKDKLATELNIPETLDGLRVSQINFNAFARMRDLRTVRIPSGVETIANGAFENCVKLEKIEFARNQNGEIASALTLVDAYAFRGCSSLKSFEAPDSLRRVGLGAFERCASLETVALGRDVENVGFRAFADCPSLRRVDLSKVKNFQFLTTAAFDGASPELEFAFPTDNPRLTPDGFLLSGDGKTVEGYLGKAKKELAIPEGVERVAKGLWPKWTKDVETLRLPKSLRAIDDGLFYRCETLKNVVIPEDSRLETIGGNAFTDCYALERFDWPKSLKSIGGSAFQRCRSLKSFTGATSVHTIGGWAFCDCESLTEVELPNGLIEIGPSAFAECGFTSIKIPASVRVMGDAALAVTPLKTIEVEEGNEALKVVDGALLSKDGKTLFRLPPALKLKSYKIPNGVEIIERAALGGNETLESVEIPASVTTIKTNAFYRNSSLKEIFIPAGVKTLDDAFPLCDALARFEVAPENAVYKSENGALLSKDGKTFYRIVAVERDSSAAPITLEGDENLSKLTKRDETSRSIPAYKSDVYVVPDGVATLADGAFSDVRRTRNAFTEIVLPQSLEKIGERAFQYCPRLETLRIPANVREIGGYLFSEPRALKTFEIDPKNVVYRVQDGMLLSADGRIFYGVVVDGDRRVLKLPEGVAYATWKTGAPKNFEELVLPESLFAIQSGAFAYCMNLTKVTIPKNVQTIESLAFSNSPKLEEVVLKSKATEYIFNAFQGVAPKCWIHVEEEATLRNDVELTPEDIKTSAEAAKVFDFVFEGNAATITGLRIVDASSLKIPAKIDDKIVVKIGFRAFYGAPALQKVELPPTLREIASEAFAHNQYLETVSPLPASLEVVVPSAFVGCSALTAFEVDPKSEAFQSVDGVLLSKGGKTLYAYPAGKKDAQYQVPDGVETIASDAFSRNAFLETVKFPWTLKAIKSQAFMSCPKLAEVHFFPVVNLLESIGERAFNNCNSLKSINLPDGIRSIATQAFGGNALETVEFYPVDVEAKPGMTIASGAFDAPSLKSFEFPETLKSLASGAVKSGVRNPYFKGKYDESAQLVATLPPNPVGVDTGAFSEMANLVEIKVDPACKAFKTVDGALLSADGKTFYFYPRMKRTEEYDIPEGVERVVTGAFSGVKVKKIRTPKTLRTVDAEAFYRSSELETLEFVEGVRFVTANALRGCGALTTLKIPATLENADQALRGARVSLTRLANVEVAPGNPALKTVDGLTLSADGKTLYFCSQEKATGEVVVPEGVETIAAWAFARRSLESIRLPKTLKQIGEQAFAFCENLASAPLPDGLEVVGSRAFQNCGALSSILLPASVNMVETSAFASCDALKSIDVAAENPTYRNVDGVLLSKDGRDIRAYPCGKEATEYVAPDGVETTSTHAFHDAKKLRKVVFPKGFKSQGDMTFVGCDPNLEIVAPPPTLGETP